MKRANKIITILIFIFLYIPMAVLVVALSAAVYLNWQFSKNGGEYDITGALSSTTSYLGDVQYVGNPGDTTVSEAQSGEAYFKRAREDRAAARQEGLQILKDIMNNVKSDSAAVQQATADAMQLAKDADTESVIENLVKAKGFSECVAVIKDGQVNIVVQVADHLLSSDMLQIQDIASAQTGFGLDKITIIEVK